MISHKLKYQNNLKIRTNRDALLNLVFEVKTDWAKIAELALSNEKLEKEIKELK